MQSRLERFHARIETVARFGHSRVVTFSTRTLNFYTLARALYAALGEGRAIPDKPLAGEVYLTERDDGLVRRCVSRGFMPGMGETFTYLVVIRDDVTFGVEDWWEDNIADPGTFEVIVRARSAELLELAIAALEKFW